MSVSTGHLHSGSNVIDTEWVDELIAQVDKDTDFNTDYEIPYCGGSSQDWSPGHRVVFIDKDIPTSYK